MPQITVDYTGELDDSFDRAGFARALHPLVAETVSTKITSCKTRFRPVEETTVGDVLESDMIMAVGDVPGSGAIVHISIGLLPGRTPEVKAQLTEAVLDLLDGYIEPVAGVVVHTSAETRDLDPSYRSR